MVRKEAEVPGLGEGDREEERSEGRKAGKGGRKRTSGREVPVLEELGACRAPEVEREGGASPLLRSAGGPGFPWSLRTKPLQLLPPDRCAAVNP